MCSNTCECFSVETTNQDDKGNPLLNHHEYSCRKCSSTKPFLFIDKSIIECKECFLTSCNKKIRSTIGKSKLLKNNDSILVGYSGGMSSTALLDLIRRSMEFVTRREQKFRVSIIHIDTQSTVTKQFSISNQTRLDNLSLLLESIHKSYPDWNIYFSLVELVTLDPNKSPMFYKYDSSADINMEHLNNLLNQSNSSGALEALDKNVIQIDTTDKIDYYNDCVIKMIDRIANSINKSETTSTSDQIKFVFTGASSTQLANNLLVDVILGRGSSIHSTVNICDQRPTVPIVRPMRDFSKKEIAFYLKARGIELNSKINLSTMSDRKASIQKTTEAFLTKLNSDFPSTYNILLRTGTKMQDVFQTNKPNPTNT